MHQGSWEKLSCMRNIKTMPVISLVARLVSEMPINCSQSPGSSQYLGPAPPPPGAWSGSTTAGDGCLETAHLLCLKRAHLYIKIKGLRRSCHLAVSSAFENWDVTVHLLEAFCLDTTKVLSRKLCGGKYLNSSTWETEVSRAL